MALTSQFKWSICLRASKFSGVIAVGCLILAFGANAQTSSFVDGNELNKVCGGTSPEASLGCVSYVMGVYDTTLLYGSMLEKKQICLVPGMSGNQVALIVRRYLDNNPDKLHWQASPLVFNALVEAFRCTPSLPSERTAP